jgi:hypothetical protein
MAGQTIRLIEMTRYDFSNVAASAEGGVNVAQHIDVSMWRYATLMIRVHSATIGQANAELKVKAFADGYTAEDPSLQFGSAPELASVTIAQSNVSSPYYITADLTAADMGSLVTVVLSGAQDTQRDDLYGVFSIDLAMKD